MIFDENEVCEFVRVYNYTLDTAKKMERDGWKLVGTYYQFLSFRRDK